MKPTDVTSGLTLDHLKLQLHYAPDTGNFTWLNGSSKKTGHLLYINKRKENPYLLIGLLGRNFLCHRLAWFYMTGTWPSEMIDHINGNK